MQNAKCRVQSAEQNGNGESRTLRKYRPFCTPHSAFCTRAFTLIEMLVVMGIIGMLAGMLTAIILHARNLSFRVGCQQNLNHIGQAVSLLVLSNNGLYPIGPQVSRTLPGFPGSWQGVWNSSTTYHGGDIVLDSGAAYYCLQSNTSFEPPNSNWGFLPGMSNAYPNSGNDSGFPWWARVFEQMEGNMEPLFAKNTSTENTVTEPYLTNGAVDPIFNPNGHVLTAQLPQTMNVFHCPAASPLDGSSVVNLFNSISYGINFDMKDSGRGSGASPWPPLPAPQTWPPGPPFPPPWQRPYNSSFVPFSSLSYSSLFPNYLNANDEHPDQYRATEIQNPSQFILLSEANTQGPEWNGTWVGAWTNGASWPASQAITYEVGAIVLDGGVCYRCVTRNSNSEPPNANWQATAPIWTGGRISPWNSWGCSFGNWQGVWNNGSNYSISDMVLDRGVAYYCLRSNTQSEPPNSNWRILQGIVGRHGGYANVLFADDHVELMEVAADQVSANLNINYNTPLWTLPGR
jgi:prepilin-type N-terminal cleavage/methylation domain-containing protein/prepilin-type processing-associated H-X9-DG protein